MVHCVERRTCDVRDDSAAVLWSIDLRQVYHTQLSLSKSVNKQE